MKLSIVTIHLNNIEGLKRTLKSLIPIQDVYDVEWIVVDGGSEIPTTSSRVIEQVFSRAAQFISEADEGIYDAMNKGTRLANGEYVLYLNAGDELHPEFDPGRFSDSVSGNSADMLWGRCEVHYQDGTRLKVKPRSPRWAWYCMPAFHPAILFRRDALGDNPYDTAFRLAADYDLVCRLLAGDARVVQNPEFISVYHRGGASDVYGDAARAEESRIRLRYFRVPVFIDNGIKRFKKLNARQTPLSVVVRKLRKWI